jgi:RHS repeat-associated protein
LFHLAWEKRKRGSNNRFRRAAFNLAALFLIILTLIVPLEPAFAQSADATATPSSDSVTTGTPALGSDQSDIDNSIPATPATETAPTPAGTATPDNTPAPDSASAAATVDTTQPASTDAQSSGASSGTGTASGAGQNPKGNATPSGIVTIPSLQPIAYSSFGQDHLTIDKNTGALDTTFPITIAPGRNNLQPDVDLTYSSQNTQLGSIFGEGWSVSIPYIERLNKTGVDNLYSTSTPDYFTSSVDGELATTTASSSYIARTENGTFNKYTFTNNEWTMTDKNGTQYTFGSTADSQQSDPNNASDTYKWMLKQVTDTNNNTITYSYFNDSGQIYPSSTLYTGNGSSTGIFEVDFLRTSSTDNATSSWTGFGVKSNYRVSEIDAKVNGTWVRKYALAYTTGDNGSTTLLSSITESGQNASGTVVTLPAATFSYQTQTPGWTSSSTWNSPLPFVSGGVADNGVRIADVNGDNLPDVLSSLSASGSTSSQAYVNDGPGWTSSSTWDPPIPFMGNDSDNGVRIADVNGDGLPDLLSAIGASGSNSYAAYINTGSGWQSSSTWDPPLLFVGNGQDMGVRIADVNGDGLPDILSGLTANGTTTYAAYINNGHGWTLDPTWDPPIPFADSSGNDLGVQIVDVNGDGLPDIISGSSANGSTTYAAYINNGHGWTLDPTWDPPLPLAGNGADNGVRIADVNGDGLPDILSGVDVSGSSSFSAYINNGHGWTSDPSWDSPEVFLANGTDSGARIVDVNGDGLNDVLLGVDSTFSSYINNNQTRADLLTGITYPKGGSSAISYKSATEYENGSGALLNIEPYPVYVVSQITNNDGTQNVASTTYAYAGGSYYYNASSYPYDMQFAGFSTVTETDSAGNVTKTYYHTGNGTDSADGEYADNFWKIGKPYRVASYDNASNLYKLTITKWDSASLGSNAAFVFPDQTLTMNYDGLSTHDDSAEAYSWNDTTGNQTQKIQWGQVSGSNNGSFTDTGSDEYVTSLTYASSTTSNVIGKIADETMTNQSSTKIQETQYYYDGLSLGSVSTGNLTEEANWISGSTYATTQNSYNGYGLVTQSLDPRNNTTTYSYDSFNLYPATTTNALSQSTGYTYDYSTGKPTQTVDPNGDIFQTTYDGLGRSLQVMEPDPITSSTLDLKTAYTYTDTANAVSVHESDYLNGSTTVDTYSYYDGLGRLIQTRKSSQNSGTYKVTDLSYNNVNLLAEESLPYFASSSAKAAATTTVSLFTTYTYDPLQRTLTTTNAVGTTTDTYGNWEVTITDPRGKQKNEFNDAYGNLVQVNEHNGSSTYSTYYTYDGLQDLMNITDALGNVRNFTYDGLGRKLTAQDLHASTATTYGSSTYAYDNAGNLTQTVDAKNQTVNYTYDALNRVSTEDYTGQSGTEFTYTYDSCTQGISRLCTVSSTDDLVNDTYNGLGQLAQESETIASTTYATSYTYDRQGNQLTITNPDNSEIEYAYNSAGLVQSVSQEPSGGSFAYVVSSFTYSPTDQPTVIDYANGVTETNTYDATKIYRLTQKVGTLSGGGNAQNISYTYDADGNITQLVDAGTSGTGKTVNYTYDDLSRLTNASTTNVSTTPSYDQTFTYDALGNILTGPLGTFTYGSTASSTYADPDAATNISTSSSTSGGVLTPTLDATSTNISVGFNAGPVTKSWTHTVAASSTVLLLTADILQDASGTGTVASATWKGTALTKIRSALSGPMDSEIWYLASPSVGSGTIAVTVSGATDAIKLGAESFTGVATSSPIDASSTATGTSGNPSSSITTATSSDLIIDTLSRNSTTTATTNQTLLYNDASAGSGGGSTSTPAFVQGAVTSTANVATFGSSVTTGDLIVVGVTDNGTSVPTNAITDNKGNTYTRAVQVENTSTDDYAAIFYAKNVTGGSSFAVTMTSTVAGSLAVQEYSGVATSTPLDQIATSTGASGNPTSGNVTTAIDHELYFGLAWNGNNGATWTAGTGYTLRENITNNASAERLATEDKVVTTATTTAATFTTSSTEAFAAAIATFKPATTAGGGSATGTLAAASYQVPTSTGTFSDAYTGSASQNWSMVMAALKPAPVGTTGSSGIALTYDNNGNLLTYGTSTTNTWNYRNQLTQSVNANGTSTYAYDYLGNRVKLVEGATTTIFPTTFYNVASGSATTTTEHIFADGLLVGTVQNTTTGGGGGGSGTSTIALDATSTSITNGFNAGPITKSWTHTITGSSTILVLMADLWQDTGGTGTVASATWKGVAFTKVKAALSGNMDSEVWYLAPTSTGAGTLSVTVTGATDAIKFGAASFTGVSTSSPLDASSTATGTSGTPSASITTATSSDLVIDTLSRYTTTNATTSKTALFRDNSNSTLAAGSYQLATSSGSYSDSYTGSASDDWSMVIAAFKPGTGTGGGSSSSTTSTTVQYVLDDTLGGSSVVTNASGTTVLEALDYYPYGQIRIDTTTGGYQGEKRKFDDTEFDALSGFNYMQARYQDPSRGQFLSQDPMYLALGSTSSTLNILPDPQQLNAYSYGRDNPIVESDPSGKDSATLLVPLIPAGIGFTYGLVNEYTQNVVSNIENGKTGFSALNPNLSNGGYEKYGASAFLDAAVATIATYNFAAAIPLYFGSSLFMQKVNNPQQPPSYLSAALDTTIDTAVPVSVDEIFGKISGPEVSTFSERILTSAHFTRDIEVETLISELENSNMILGSLGNGNGSTAANTASKNTSNH